MSDLSSDVSSDSSLPRGNKRRSQVLSSDSNDDSDVPIRRPKLIRRPVIVFSDSDSDSDSSVGDTVPLSNLRSAAQPSRRNRAGNALSDSESSHENIQLNESSGDETDTSSQASPSVIDIPILGSPLISASNNPSPSTSGAALLNAGNQSDTSEGNSDKCPICLGSFSNQDIGTPENCEHLFCADCITEWSKNVNTCPVDRLTFSLILVRRRIGGKVIKRIPVGHRRPSEDEFFMEDTTFCEICHLSNSEETMLLCDSCDRGYHMHCLTPPLSEVPDTEWYCASCSELQNNRDGSELNLMGSSLYTPLMSHVMDVLNTLHRQRRVGSSNSVDRNMPSTSGATSSRRRVNPSTTNRSTNRQRSRRRNTNSTTTQRRRYRRARTRNVVVEYEMREGEKFPIKVKKKKITRRKRRKAPKRAPRTAARRALVRSSVRGRLAEQKGSASAFDTTHEMVHNHLAVPKLSLFGNRNEFDYFPESEDEDIGVGFGSGGTAVAIAPRSVASAIFDSHRQIRRKMISISSPPYASSAPDLLSSILESQTLLHSKSQPNSRGLKGNNTSKSNSTPQSNGKSAIPGSDSNKRLDIVNQDANSNVKEVPGYPGGGGRGNNTGGGGNWRGGQGYQGHGGGRGGSYSHPQSTGDYSSGGGFTGDNSSFQGNRSFQNNSPWQSNCGSDMYQRRDQLDYSERSPMQRSGPNIGRGRGSQYRFGSQVPSRSQPVSPWQGQQLPDLSRSFSGQTSNVFPSISEMSNPVDMTTSHEIGYNIGAHPANFSDIGVYRSPQNMNQTTSMPQPPIIRFQKPPLSEDEKSDTSQLDEADKYDPTEPTIDDSSSEEETTPRPINVHHNKLTIVSPPRKDTSLVAEYGSGSESSSVLPVSSNILDQAVQQVLQEHKELISSHKKATEPESGGESDGDCPNFSIYSSTGIDITKNKKENNENKEPVEQSEEDLVQEDDFESVDGNRGSNNTDIDSIPIPQDDISEETKKGDPSDYNTDWSDHRECEVDAKNEESTNENNQDKKQINNLEVNDIELTENCLEESMKDTSDIKDNISEDMYDLLGRDEDVSEHGNSCENDTNAQKEPESVIPLDTSAESNQNDSEKAKCDDSGSEKDNSDDLGKTNEQNRNVEFSNSDSIKSNSTPQKRTPITIKLLSSRNIKKNSFNLYDKEDYGDISELNDSTSNIEEEISPVKHSTNDDSEMHSSVDEEFALIKKSNTSELLPADIEKLTECISDAEDERSYTPCLDENKSNKSKDTTFESEKENIGIGGLDTEMISEDEGNEIFSDHNNPKTDSDGGALELSVRDTELQPGEFEEGEIIEKRKQKVKEKVKALLQQPENKIIEDDKKKKKKEKKNEKDGKDKSKSRAKKGTEDSSFKKLSKSGKERNYRDRDDKNKSKNKEKRSSKSPDKDKKDKAREKKKEKRKDIERYDVRNIISDKTRRVKDAFGRDTSRPRSKSPDSRIGSPIRFRRSVSRKRSLSRGRRSTSRGRRSVSRVRRSISRGRRSISKKKRSVSRGRRSFSRRRRSSSRVRKSISKNGKSVSPFRRSMSPRFRRSISPRIHKARSPKRRSISPRGRSPVIRGKRSISPRPRRSKSPRLRRSVSRLKNKRGKRSLSRGRRLSPRLHREISPRRRPNRRSRGRSLSKNRSVSPKVRKSRKLKRHRSNSIKRKVSKSPHKSKAKRRRSRSFSPGLGMSRSPSLNRANVPRQWVVEKSPLFQEWSSGSQSMSPPRASPGWTPPPQRHKSPQPDNLRVILTTKEKSKKKDKKKKINKKNKTTDRILPLQQKDTGPSKEVFTSGNNILVSVSFNKNQDNQENSVMPLPDEIPKKKKHKTDATTKSKKDKNKDKIKKKRGDKGKRAKNVDNKKPVAIIDLDKSPFKELTPSPKAVIVLSDSDNGEKEEELMERQEMLRGELLEMGFPQSDDVESPQRSPVGENTYVPTAGPKTPPEPAIKFTISNKANPQLRAVNPLHEKEDETPPDEATEEKQETEKRSTEITHKGPNTPPEPPNSPSSPDAYDPFEPTKSGSATPERPSSPQPEKHPEKRPEELLQVPSMSLEAAQKSNLTADDVIQARPISPMEKVLALLKSTRNNLSPANTVQPLYSEQIYDTNKNVEVENQLASTIPIVTVQSPERTSSTAAIVVPKSQSVYSAVVKPSSPKVIYSTVTPTVVTSTPAYLNPSVPRIGAYTTGTPPSNQRIVLPSPTKSSPLKTQSSKLFMTKPSPIKSTPIKPMPSKTIISKLPMPTIKPLPTRNQKNIKGKNGQNGNDVIELDLDMDSPYSPGSNEFDECFDPPADNEKHTNNTYSQNKQSSKYDVFDSLFAIKPAKKSALTKVPVKQTKRSKGKTQVGVRMDEDTLRILDDLPSSAVEMQVKTKFLKKLNRQERVVEEVKLVLKPHYNKKHISKEDYKEILRRAVPKICHNRSGEINPAKIHALIEAYVRKFRKKAHQVK